MLVYGMSRHGLLDLAWGSIGGQIQRCVVVLQPGVILPRGGEVEVPHAWRKPRDPLWEA